MKKRKELPGFGTFAPLHRGILTWSSGPSVRVWSRSCHRFWGFWEGDRGERRSGLDLTKNTSAISVSSLQMWWLKSISWSETDCHSLSPLGWEPWLQTWPRHHPVSSKRQKLIFYVGGEKAYKEELLEARGFEVLRKASLQDLCFTMIRRKSQQILKYIAPALPSPVLKKSWSWGASNGKRPLARAWLALMHLLVLERPWCQDPKNNVRDDELRQKITYYLLLGQYDQTSKQIF